MDKPLYPLAKLVLLGAGGLALAAGPILYIFPHDTETYFAWTIQHPLTPVFMGASYLAGLGNLVAVRAKRWSLARVQMPAILVFAVTMLIATLLHLPLFNWSHPVAWAWLAVYVVSPFAVLLVLARMESGYEPPEFYTRQLPPVFKPVMLGVAAIFGTIGLVLFLFPAQTAPLWPWSLTPLTARVIGGWWLSSLALHWMLARQTTLETARVGLLADVLVTSLLLLGAALHFDRLNGPPMSVWLYLTFNLFVWAFAIRAWRAAR